MFSVHRIIKKILGISILLALLSPFAWSQELSFRQAIQLALKHSPAIGIAAADQLHAKGAYDEVHNQYKPNVVFGSGVGYSYGYPLSIEGSAPSIFNVNYNSTVYSPAVSAFQKSAKLQWHAAAQTTEDQRKDVILDTAVSYVQLDKLLSELKQLSDEQKQAQNLVAIVTERVQQGVDTQMDLTRAKLVAARAQMQIAQAEGAADVLRTKLSQLTGIPAESLTTNTTSIPKLPEVDQHADLASQALANSGAVKAADERARAELFRAKGEWRAAYLPSFDLAAQYGLFSNYLNNYQDFFLKFQRNNASFGLVIRFPILNFVQHAKADEAAADAVKAKKQAEQVKDQISTQTLQLQRLVRQLAAAERVAKLDYELAQAEAKATEIRASQGAPAPTGQGQTQGAAPITAQDVSNAEIVVADKYSQYVNASFELDKARLQLLRQTGHLDGWALHGK